MEGLLKVVLISMVFTIVQCNFPLDFEEPVFRSNEGDIIYRLPEDLDPINIKVEITPYFEDEGNNTAFTFDGIVSIRVVAKSDISSLIIHENVREIVSVSLTTENGVIVPLQNGAEFERIREYHFLKVNLADGFTLNKFAIYNLQIVYVGNINETPLSRGVFRGSYKGSDNKIHWYAATHLQPTNSRQAFPCFDEPGFKSTFDIIINRPITFTETFSNMRIKEQIAIGNRLKETFHTTPRMSAYLVTFHISEEFTAIANNNSPLSSYRILARPNAQGQGNYALEVGPPLTEWLSEYFQIEYYTMAENMKNDQIASPDWASGATENWGLVSYRELRLLYEEGETNALDKMYIATITAHELAHKWFGNLITCRWWENVWINEGFASYFEYFAAHAIDPSMELDDQFILRNIQSSLSSDQSTSTRALQHIVNSPAQVTGHFSGISYTKGASLLHMLNYLIGGSTFKKALYYFLTDNSYEYANPSDLYQSFEKAVVEDNIVIYNNINIKDFMQYWVEQPGYPLLNVEVNMDTGVISLSQSRYFISASAAQTNQVWPIPLTFTTGSSPSFALRPHNASYIMWTQNMEIKKTPGHEWVIFNIQQRDLYRVNYDSHTWEMIADALNDNFHTIHYMNRAQIVDDVFALMRSEHISFELGWKILNFLKKDTSYYSWYPAITGFNWIRHRFLHLPELLEEFDGILYEFLDAVISELGYNVQTGEPVVRTLHRSQVLSFACSIGHQGCVTDAISKFNDLMIEGISVNPNLRRHVFCSGIHNGGYLAWRFIYERRLNSNNQADEAAMLRSLGCTVERWAVEDYLKMILSDDVKAQDSANAFTFLFMGDPGNARAALPFFKNEVDSIRKKLVLSTWFDSVLSNLASYMEEDGLNEMEQWLQSSQETIPNYQVGLNAIANRRATLHWGRDNAEAILDSAKGSANIALPTATLLLASIILLWS